MFFFLLAHSLRSCASFRLGRRYIFSECLFSSPCVYSYASARFFLCCLFLIVCTAHALKFGNGARNFTGGVGFRLAPPRQLGGCVRAHIVCVSRVCYLFHYYQSVSLIAFAPSLAACPPNPPAALARSAPVPGSACGCYASFLAKYSGVVTYFTCGCWSLF